MTVVIGQAAVLRAFIWLAEPHLFVIDRLFFVEHTNIFVTFQGLDIRVQEITAPLFVPDQVITPHPSIGKNQLGREQAISKQHDCAML